MRLSRSDTAAQKLLRLAIPHYNSKFVLHKCTSLLSSESVFALPILLNEFQRTEMALAQRRVFTDTDPNVQKLLALRQSQLALLQSEVGRL